MVHSYTDGWSQVSQVHTQNGIETPERLELLFKFSHLEYLGPPPPIFGGRILVPQPLIEPAPLAVEAPGKSQLALF